LRQETGAAVEWIPLDLASMASVRAAAAEVEARCPRLDVLVNNAGAVLSRRTVTPDGFETTFAVNYLGPFLFTQLLLGRLEASAPSRIVNLTSSAHYGAIGGLRFDDLQTSRLYSGVIAYCRAKLAVILWTRELARRLQGRGVTANAVHPGMVGTRFALDGDVRGPVAWFFRYGTRVMKTPEQGATTSVIVASDPTLETVSGGYFAEGREARPSLAARDDAVALRLWQVSEALVRP
ncbi:MAG TPA: SDR family NAD(P)-dependent oxidoreductase, partial [Acidimicrobiia bacterium]|nr:SDR family NAD(P)-dependent oxidoreductase [Acidimicrobiia bacterium]